MDWDIFRKEIEDCLSIPSPSGDTGELLDFLETKLQEMNVETSRTKKGAVIAKIPGEYSESAKMLAAHVDTLGAMVKEIKDNGRLKVTGIGGYSWTSVEGENVTVKVRSGKKFQGSLLPEEASVHCFPETAREQVRLESNMEIRLDEPVFDRKETEKLGIRPGDLVVFEPRTVFLENGYIKSRYLDDKVCVAILLELIRTLKRERKRSVYFYFSNYEEIGHGISILPKEVEELVALDIGTVAKGYQSEEHCVSICAKDAKTVYDLDLRRRLERLAEQEGIDYHTDVYYRYGSDASAVLQQMADVRCALVGPGVDATHHYERTHVDGIISTLKLLQAYLEETEG